MIKYLFCLKNIAKDLIVAALAQECNFFVFVKL